MPGICCTERRGQALLGSRVTMCWSHSFRGNLWLRQFSKTQLSKFFAKQMEITWPHHVVCSSFIYLGWKKLLWSILCFLKQNSSLDSDFFMLKQKQNLKLQIYSAVGNIVLANHLQSSPAPVNFPRFSGATKDPQHQILTTNPTERTLLSCSLWKLLELVIRWGLAIPLQMVSCFPSLVIKFKKSYQKSKENQGQKEHTCLSWVIMYSHLPLTIILKAPCNRNPWPPANFYWISTQTTSISILSGPVKYPG